LRLQNFQDKVPEKGVFGERRIFRREESYQIFWMSTSGLPFEEPAW